MTNYDNQFQYPHIASGYIGIKQPELTLNSSYFVELLANQHLLDNPLIFPQRVLKTDFFKELAIVEGNNYHQKLKKLKHSFIKKAKTALDNNHSTRFFNLLNLMLRYGLHQKILTLNLSEFMPYLDLSHSLEIQLIKEIAKQRLSLTPQMEILHIIANQALHDDSLTDRVRILTLNYLIVAFYRFNIKLDCIKKCYKKLIELLGMQTNNDFANILRTSVAYRGLAMVKDLGISSQEYFLDKTLFLARNIKFEGKVEEILAKENL